MTLMKTLQKNGFSIPSNFFAIVSIPTVIKKKENLIVAAERGNASEASDRDGRI